MNTQITTSDLLEELAAYEMFAGLPDDVLQWIFAKSEYVHYTVDETLFVPDTPADYMLIVLKGAYKVALPQGDGMRELGIWEAPHVTGLLPFSRMKETKAFGLALTEVHGLRLHKEYFTEMVKVSYELAQRLVGALSDRIRNFEQSRLQTEKLMSLGKLSAGLAHELNNPASAIVRSVEELYDQIHYSPHDFKEVITMKITPEQTDQINAVIFPKIEELGQFEDLSLLEQESRKDDLIDWLEDHNIDQAEDLADTFVEFDLTEDNLDDIADALEEEALGPVLRWAKRVLSMEKIVAEIRESSDRIAGLVSSVKAYTHMDQSSVIEARPIHEGIKSTIMMLKHKLKQKQITLEKELDREAPPVEIVPGEMNQVWTNLIDNAIDAMPATGGRLHIRTYRKHGNMLVDITDNGSGIPEDVLSKIYDPFFTTKGVGEGTGLGLEVTRRIVEKHKGVIEVDSQPGKTTFTVCLPITQS